MSLISALEMMNLPQVRYSVWAFPPMALFFQLMAMDNINDHQQDI